MTEEYSEKGYRQMLDALFLRFPSFQKVGAAAYKPGIDNMLFFDQLAGHPHRKYKTIHIAGTNGKGSVANMLASVCAAAGLKTGLYTSPHILDFRERMRVAGPESGRGTDGPGQNDVRYISEKEVWDFVHRWGATFEHLDLSFFEITTMMAFDWFASRNVDIAVIETGLGGRLDSTNIITPELSIITCIGLDHCDMLGSTLGEIAFEKAGIIKPNVPVVVGESDPETDPVFEHKVLYTNLPSPVYMGDRTKIMSLLVFADKTVPPLWEDHEDMLGSMDLRGDYQSRNLRTALAAIDVLEPGISAGAVRDALIHTAARTGFHGRWETVSGAPYIICDIGHNSHGLKYNFHQLSRMLSGGECSSLIIVYGSVSDKDYESVFPLIPEDAYIVFASASGKRALPADVLKEKYTGFCIRSGRSSDNVYSSHDVASAVALALKLYGELCPGGSGTVHGLQDEGNGSAVKPLVYIGGSTYVVAEALSALRSR